MRLGLRNFKFYGKIKLRGCAILKMGGEFENKYYRLSKGCWCVVECLGACVCIRGGYPLLEFIFFCQTALPLVFKERAHATPGGGGQQHSPPPSPPRWMIIHLGVAH